MRQLKPKELKFIEGYLSHGNGSQAAKDAGYPEHRAAKDAYKLLRMPAIAEMLAASRKAVVKKAEYGLSVALSEAEEARQRAITNKNSMAEVKAVQLKSELGGLLNGPDKALGNVFNINLSSIAPQEMQTVVSQIIETVGSHSGT